MKILTIIFMIFFIPITAKAQEAGGYNYFNLLGFLALLTLVLGLLVFIFRGISSPRLEETTKVSQEQTPKESANVKEEADSLLAHQKIDQAIGAILGIKIQETMSYEEAGEIASEYGSCLEKNKAIHSGARALSALPQSKEKIKIALAKLVILDQDEAVKELACATYIFLDDFVEDDIYTPLANAFGKVNSENVQNISESEMMELAKNIAESNDFINEFKKHRQSNRVVTLNELIKLRTLVGLEVEDYVNMLSELREENT